MAEAKGNFPIARKICGEDSENIWCHGLQACDYLRDLNFQKLYGSDVGPDFWEMPMSFKNSFALMFLVNLRSNICFVVSIVSSYLVEPHYIGAKNLLRCLQDTISHGLRYIAGNMKLHDYSNAD